MKYPWDFVEKYYPNYHGCSTIAYLDDLRRILDGEYEEGDSAHTLLKSDYEGDSSSHWIVVDHNETMMTVYERAIEGFISEMEKK